MAQRKQLTWSELRVGIFVLLGLILIAVAVFYVTGTGVFASKYQLITYLPEVDGLSLGAPVTLNGVQVGNVTAIRMNRTQGAKPVSESRSVEVVMQVNRQYQDYVRTDSTASLITEGFLGNREVTIKRGYTGRVLKNGEEVNGVEEKAMQQIVSNGVDLMENLNALSMQISDIVGDIKNGRGTLGKLLVDETAYNRLNDTLGRVDQITTAVQQGQGTLGQLVRSDELYSRMDSAAGHLDNVLDAVQQQRGSLGKFIYDPTIHDEAKSLLGNSDAVFAGIRSGRGTLGKLATDDSLFTAWRQTGHNLAEVTAKLNSTHGSAGEFFSDPHFYDNLTGLTGDLRLLIGEFRTNPKKFLHVKFSIF
jgi:phospholipid/cholesterol/gamma-HCH transport system substrate-binding protein